jgi:hypothetical protein
MKKLFLSAVVLVAFASFAFGQVSLGLRAGLNLSNNKFSAGSIDIKPDMKAGFLVGAYLTGNISDNIAIQPELLFTTFGSKGDDFGKTDLNYICIPVLLRYNFNEMVNIHVGPQFNMLMSAENEGDDIKDDLKGLDVGALVGLGADFGPFNAGVRYFAGLSNISEDDSFELKNSAFQIFVGFRLIGGD